MIDWPTELPVIFHATRATLPLYVALIALRSVENGRDGREFGVLSEEATTYDRQLAIAKNSLTNHVTRVRNREAAPWPVYDPASGFFTDEFLIDFSHKYAPIDSTNDPHGLNANHAPNLVKIHRTVVGLVRQALVTVTP